MTEKIGSIDGVVGATGVEIKSVAYSTQEVSQSIAEKNKIVMKKDLKSNEKGTIFSVNSGRSTDFNKFKTTKVLPQTGEKMSSKYLFSGILAMLFSILGLTRIKRKNDIVEK